MSRTRINFLSRNADAIDLSQKVEVDETEQEEPTALDVKKLYVGIDVGIICLAICWMLISDSWFETKDADVQGNDKSTIGGIGASTAKLLVEDCALINLMLIADEHHCNLQLLGLKGQDGCSIPHSKMLCDRLAHFFAVYERVLNAAVRIFVEQQPPMGHTAVEQLIVAKYRDKVTLISPNSMHKHFGMNHFKDPNKREKRKIVSISLMKQIPMTMKCRQESERLILEEEKRLIPGDTGIERAHDVADSILVLRYGIYLLKQVALRKRAATLFSRVNKVNKPLEKIPMLEISFPNNLKRKFDHDEDEDEDAETQEKLRAEEETKSNRRAFFERFKFGAASVTVR